MILTNNHSLLTTIGILAPFIIGIMIFFFRIETRLTRIETDITWIKHTYTQCPQNLENPTH